MHKSRDSDLRPAAVRLHFLPNLKALPCQNVIFSPCRCIRVLTLTYPSSEPFPRPEWGYQTLQTRRGTGGKAEHWKKHFHLYKDRSHV